MSSTSPTSTAGIHEAIAAAHEKHRAQIDALARQIHAHPELAFHEERAVAALTEILGENGFDLERGAGGLPTAFRGVRTDPLLAADDDRLIAAICVEYDALPGIGHGCGHHLIAGAGIGAALALAEHLEGTGVELHVIGTPAEEHGGGKQLLIDAGAFEGVDMALMMHAVPETGTYDPIGSSASGVGRWQVTFTGRAAHAAAHPEDGVNANDAAVLLQVAAGLLRQRMGDGQRMAIVPGQASLQLVTNIVPERISLEMECRALSLREFETLRDRLFAAAEGSARATGCAVEIVPTEPVYEPLLQNEILGAAWNDGMRRLGRPLKGSLGVMPASTDMGNVSQRMPGLHPFVGIPGVTEPLHTRGFAEASLRPEAFALMHDSALAMAWLIHDIATDPARRRQVLAEAARMRG